ncbi:MAG: putative toxin-antitoxin system toxin component, PIN family [Steroidobacteraceae bacterium]|nr:putative toxin-antitoxin system toxin component, PIN family [Steroidobacteraceae bacterium]
MQYPKVRKRVALGDAQLWRFVAELRYLTEVVDIRGVVARVPKDRRDDMFLATSLASSADCLVTGDRDLLKLAPDHPVLTAREFCDQYLR